MLWTLFRNFLSVSWNSCCIQSFKIGQIVCTELFGTVYAVMWNKIMYDIITASSASAIICCILTCEILYIAHIKMLNIRKRFLSTVCESHKLLPDFWTDQWFKSNCWSFQRMALEHAYCNLLLYAVHFHIVDKKSYYNSCIKFLPVKCIESIPLAFCSHSQR